MEGELGGPARGFVRLFRGETDIPGAVRSVSEWMATDPTWQASRNASGRWFTASVAEAVHYNFVHGDGAGRVSFVDVPDDQLPEYRADRQGVGRFSAAGRETAEYFLSAEVAARRRPWCGTVSCEEYERVRLDASHYPLIIENRWSPDTAAARLAAVTSSPAIDISDR